jgi:hypothetical protein
MEDIARKVALIHATPLAMQPVAVAFERLWPEAVRMNLLDDRLSADLAEAGAIDAAMKQRFVDLARYAERAGAAGILYTCSAFGPAIEAAAAEVKIPAWKPNEAMFMDALEAISRPSGATPRIGLLSTFAPSVQPMCDELLVLARERAIDLRVQTECARGAIEALAAGDAAAHDRLLVEHALRLQDCDVLMLGQFSMARAREPIAAVFGRPVLTSPDSAVRRLRRALLAS